MRVTFTYDKEKDAWCLLSRGKASRHSQTQTKQYEQLVHEYGEQPLNEDTEQFIVEYLANKNISIEKYVALYQKDWDFISEEFQKRAEAIFGVQIPQNITAYLTINSRCPYSIEEDHFYVTVPTYDYIARKTAMHELWHFYTWYAFGSQAQTLGQQKYEDLKEALTVLINIECTDLLPEGVSDTGYLQHQELREKILQFWHKDKSIKNLWENLIKITK